MRWDLWAKVLLLLFSLLCQVLVNATDDIDCSIFPRSMNTNRPETGCAGAVWMNGDPSELYCKGQNYEGVDGSYPWWFNCCDWDGSVCKAKEEEPVTCYDENFQRVSDRCGRVIGTKCSVCNLPDMGYDCTGAGPKCFYTVKCTTVNHADCLEHVMSQGASCQPCCHVRGCDGNEIRQDGSRVMDTCKYMPTAQDEVCPLAGTGCPIENVIEGDTDEMKKIICRPHEECKTLYDNDGRRKNTGMNCSPTRVNIRQKSYCCSGPQEGLVHNLPVC
jgi:hypothetical protein